MKPSWSFILVAFYCILFSSCQHEKWIDLIVDDLSNFKVKNGTAEYILEDHTIIGTTKLGTPNTFLCTKSMYTDFILEFEVWADTLINSGVQIRSNSIPDYNNGRVHGYQVEIESSDRKWAGGIYDEGRRGWLYPLGKNPKGQEAFNRNEWNHYRIEAIGSNINTWVNGVHCSRLIDDMTNEGFIGLQVHSVTDSLHVGKTIKWKNMRIMTDNIESYQTAPDPEVESINTSQNN